MEEFFLALPFILYGIARLVEASSVFLLALRGDNRLRLSDDGTRRRARLRPFFRER